jgi:hypothetical protein
MVTLWHPDVCVCFSRGCGADALRSEFHELKRKGSPR